MKQELSPQWTVTGTERVRGHERELTMRMATAPIGSLALDPQNRRLFAVMQDKYGGKTLTQEEAMTELWNMQSVKQLFQGIQTARGLTEALYVTASGKVIEGNERLTALLHIKMALDAGDVYNEPETPELERLINGIPVKVLPDDITSREITMMLADMHLGGKDPWDSVNQANHIYEMHEVLGIPVEDIAYRLRKSKPWVYQKLTSFRWAREHFDRSNRWAKTGEFSYFEELYKKKGAIRDAGLDVNDDDDRHRFMDWVAQENIPRALDVRKLPKVMSYDETRELLYNGEGQRAFTVLAQYDASESGPRFAAMERMNRQLDRMTWHEYRMIANSETHRQLISDTIAKLQRALETVENTEWELDE